MSDRAGYVEPGWFTRNVFNRVVAVLTRLGISVWGSRELRVRGRKSGEWRTTPVNLLTFDGARYLVAPRGTTQWVRNLRAVAAASCVSVGESRCSVRPRSPTPTTPDPARVPSAGSSKSASSSTASTPSHRMPNFSESVSTIRFSAWRKPREPSERSDTVHRQRPRHAHAARQCRVADRTRQRLGRATQERWSGAVSTRRTTRSTRCSPGRVLPRLPQARRLSRMGMGRAEDRECSRCSRTRSTPSGACSPA